MGQGTESCGGYDVDYDPYDEGLESREWTTRDGSGICVSKMTISHLRGARRVAQAAAHNASFTDDADKWEMWVDVFDDELTRRERLPEAAKPLKPLKAPQPIRGTQVKMKCFCGCEYAARTADINRGWALTCSKSCAAIRREYGRPKATPC